MIDCPHRADQETYSLCALARAKVHIDLCTACIGCGRPDVNAPNRWLGSILLTAWLGGEHNDHEAAERGRDAILEAQGVDVALARSNSQISPMARPGDQTPKCLHLGRELTRRSCLCWRKDVYECEARNGLHVIPEKDCPCRLYEIDD
jgi:hypothetical protein